MSIPSINSGAAAAAVARTGQARDAAPAAKDKTPVFSRGSDAESKPSLGSACQVNGIIPNASYVKEATVNDLKQIIRDLKAEKVPEAKQRLAMMTTVNLDHFLKDQKIDPALLGQLKIAIHGRAEAHSALKEVYRVLEKSGASRLSSELRPPAAA